MANGSKTKAWFTVKGICYPFGPTFLIEAPQGYFVAMLPKPELARGQASLAGWVVSKAAQCTIAAYTTEEEAAQQEQQKTAVPLPEDSTPAGSA
jgi:hypothetical protein